MISRMRANTSASAASSHLRRRLFGLLPDVFIRCASCARNTPRIRLTRVIPCPLATRYPFSRLTILHCFFEDLNFHVFLPSKRCNSFICFIAAASSEAGTTSSPAATAVRLPSRYYFFHLSNRLG